MRKLSVLLTIYLPPVYAQGRNLKLPGFLHSKAARIGFIVGMVLLGIVLICLTFWAFVGFSPCPTAARRKRRAAQIQPSNVQGG